MVYRELADVLRTGGYGNPQLVCVECGAPCDSLYREYSQGNIRLTRCVSEGFVANASSLDAHPWCAQKVCNRVVDKYVEMDGTLVFIDMVLQRKRVYRHLLFNFIPHPASGYTPWTLFQACLVMVFLEVIGRQYAYAASRSPGAGGQVGATGGGLYTVHLLDNLLAFGGAALLEGTVFALVVLAGTWALRHPQWWGGVYKDGESLLQRTMSRCVPGLPLDRLPWRAMAEVTEEGESRTMPTGADDAEDDGLRKRGGGDEAPATSAAADDTNAAASRASGWPAAVALAWGVVCSLILGSFGRLAGLLLMVWPYPPLFVTAISAFVLLSQVTALSASLDVRLPTAGVLILAGTVVRVGLQLGLLAGDFAPASTLF